VGRRVGDAMTVVDDLQFEIGGPLQVDTAVPGS
jgi:hypothetical protein